jgi:ABC-type multidrug transport system ATPase subunit
VQGVSCIHHGNLDSILTKLNNLAPRNRIVGVSLDRYVEHMRDVIMAIFGLTHTLNTKVGNDFVRGVSGGERKRVSIAEAYVFPS